jgi:hypothetical protein
MGCSKKAGGSSKIWTRPSSMIARSIKITFQDLYLIMSVGRAPFNPFPPPPTAPCANVTLSATGALGPNSSKEVALELVYGLL